MNVRVISLSCGGLNNAVCPRGKLCEGASAFLLAAMLIKSVRDCQGSNASSRSSDCSVGCVLGSSPSNRPPMGQPICGNTPRGCEHLVK